MNTLKHKRNELARRIGKEFREFNKKACSDCPTMGINPKTKEKGCCGDCSDSNGYFHNHLDKCHWPLSHKKQFENLSKRYSFDSVYGFFDPVKKTCKLRRQFRSFVCVRHICYEAPRITGIKINRNLISELSSNYKEVKDKLGELV